jgi:hypothetical protein
MRLKATFREEDTGWRVRKNPVAGEVFFLNSPFIELIGRFRHLPILQPTLMNSFAHSIKGVT